jgi:selenocysteine lyase/cysteine desulfurase
VNLERYFNQFRKDIIGINQDFECPDGIKRKIVYADWTASGRSYGPIEERISQDFLPFVANTHTETSSTGMAMTHAYHKARTIVKEHINASDNDVLISASSGMTGVINKFQRILGMRVYEKYKDLIHFEKNEKPIVFVSHMEHHSNQTSWLETLADVRVIPPDENGLVSIEQFKKLLHEYKDRKMKIAAITSCSNVTGILVDYLSIAEEIHKQGGYCFVDFACSAPYIPIDMHPEKRPLAYLDAIYFSPHKFLGGPGSSGILVFNKDLYHNKIPDNPGGGTVVWTNPWGVHDYIDDIETREDGGTPAFLQTIQVALSIKLKEKMDPEKMLAREHEQLALLWEGLDRLPNLTILADEHRTNRLSIISFYIEGLHYNLGVKMLNDKFGIQTRGGCSCAGTYGHYLLALDENLSAEIEQQVLSGDCSLRPGWIRLSIHPTTTDKEIRYIVGAITALHNNFQDWTSEYRVNYSTNTIEPKNKEADIRLKNHMENLFDLGITVN